MGKHKEIERFILRHLLGEEKRSFRSLRILQHQQGKIETLQKMVNENEKPDEPETVDSVSRQELLDLQNKVEELESILQQVSRFLQDEKKEVALINKLHELQNSIQYNEDCYHDLKKWTKKVEGVLLNIVCQSDENKSFCSGDFVANTGNVSVQKAWKTARKFFTTEQTYFLLSARK